MALTLTVPPGGNHLGYCVHQRRAGPAPHRLPFSRLPQSAASVFTHHLLPGSKTPIYNFLPGTVLSTNGLQSGSPGDRLRSGDLHAGEKTSERVRDAGRGREQGATEASADLVGGYGAGIAPLEMSTVKARGWDSMLPRPPGLDADLSWGEAACFGRGNSGDILSGKASAAPLPAA